MRVQVRWHTAEANARQRRETKRALGRAAEYVLQESNKYVPHDDGDLERSGNTDVEQHQGFGGTKTSSSVFYDTPYAIKMHEHPEYNFQGGRKGKYLDKTINETKEEVKRYLAEAYRRAFR